MMEQAGFWSSRSKPQVAVAAGAALSKHQISVLNAVLAAGLYDSVARVLCTPSVDVLERVACTVETPQGRAQVHPSSVNRNLQTHGWLLYQEKVGGRRRARDGRLSPGRVGANDTRSSTGEVHQDLPARHHADIAFPHAAVRRRHRYPAQRKAHLPRWVDPLPGQRSPGFAKLSVTFVGQGHGSSSIF